ncbi:MBL fold metallo-hydrolase [Cobetia sp. cqz5-12]|uniref:MBL fold metallo-hydrolase n=1 Tax=Cobetia sp. cqz5-12 TaxID=2609415 RepID=UPI0019034C57|nr:MBL fold metallo-hydrolase [Cobetia sp. cqz5-12]QQK64020.1 MBL fold metallo-hydrolase [Cobetia sp. cqz5-12]
MLSPLKKALALAALPFSLQAQAYEIEPLGEGLYRFIDDRHRSVFMITDQGALVTDPMNHAAASWLNNEIKQRFDTPVRYVVYSHNHSDHIYGGEVFDTSETTFIAHRLAAQDIANTRAKAVPPDLVFDDEMTLRLGGKEVQLRYHGPNDGRGSISMYFKDHATMFVVDWIVIGRMPWQKLWSYDIQGMINSTREVLEYDFDTFVGGHAEVGDHADVERYLAYLESLYSQVTDGILAGKSLEKIQQEVDLSEYSDLAQYEEWVGLNIEGVHERLMEESGMGWRSDLKGEHTH